MAETNETILQFGSITCTYEQWNDLTWLKNKLTELAAAPSLPSVEELLNRLITGLEPNGYPLWFNRAVHECGDCDSEDLCSKHYAMAKRKWVGCDAEIAQFRAALSSDKVSKEENRNAND